MWIVFKITFQQHKEKFLTLKINKFEHKSTLTFLVKNYLKTFFNFEKHFFNQLYLLPFF